jgi:hypothetical protein
MQELIAEHKQGLSWFDVMKRDYPDRVVFRFLDEVAPTPRARPHSVPPTPMRPLGPYDVIDRLGRHESIQLAHPPAAQTEACADVAGSKRGTDAANGLGSGNPNPRKTRRDAHCAQVRAERAENQPAAGKAKGAAVRKRGQPQILFN